ncbi:beta-ketoacyl-[acyl-carrier-protein] synthase family protein [Streptomyces rhizosphaerihabitans]|uniref:beta-ketoacyl-[acyl-carrier-protein] synthase family protein n=1 Tax=Streptomyces rhizosphaerihabitans TaxID=1266770 RepID=UPI0021C10363|nr:beta-ketoacyl-[acyl-carrier-protein] synthase family protein [Streptomyces rhizosphaerihabitans]MCT9004140.1 beta-ketoacyl-[acyl-carrier-protein] synthase family protein [Streptomyces rhizosphaerihabitans]
MTHPSKGAVAITGVGLVTAAGLDTRTSWERVCSGRPTAASDPGLAGLPVDFSCRVPGFDAGALLGPGNAWRLDRFTQLAIVAARQAVADAGLDPESWDGTRVGVIVGNSLGGTGTWEQQHRRFLEDAPKSVSPLMIPMGMSNMVAGHMAIDIKAFGPSMVTATACASGSNAIGLARDLLRSGTCDVVLAGGAEAALTPATITGLTRMGGLSGRRDDPGAASRPFDAARDGFVAGEGAGILVLERPEDARARGASVYANVIGFGSSTDAYHATAPDPSGAGMERALRAALADAGAGTDEVDHVNAHGTSTPLNDVAEGRVLRRVLGERPLVTSTKGVTGHALAAAGAIEAAFTALALRDGVVPPTANLTELDPEIDLNVTSGKAAEADLEVAVSTSLGFGGHNAALVFAAV